jgi:para-aminobenzoate synthetase component 1
VKRTTASFVINHPQQFKQQILKWANQFSICCLLDNHQYSFGYNSVEYLLAAGVVKTFEGTEGLSQLNFFQKNTPDWILGHVSYDFKNSLELLNSKHPDGIGFPDIFFFQPETVIQLSGNRVEIATLTGRPEDIYSDILHHFVTPSLSVTPSEPVTIQPRITKEEYLGIIHQLRQHILYGDCYEINFCQEFFSENVLIDSVNLYQRLTRVSPVPFAAISSPSLSKGQLKEI